MSLTVSMPYYRTPDMLERAVRSVLDQTHTELTLIVANDGDGGPDVWDPIAHITDPRLVRFDLTENRGRYYADTVAYTAATSEWFTVHDSDDWSEPDRYERFFTELARTGADAVFGGYRQHRLDGQPDRIVKPRLQIQRRSTTLHHVAHHTGIYRLATARAKGIGPHPAYRVAWDTFMIGMIAREMRWCQVDDPLYHHCHRQDSLMQSEDTKKDSEYRRMLWQELRVDRWRQYLSKRVKPEWPDWAAEAVAEDSARLREMLP